MFTSNEFYCSRCGNRGIPIVRKKGQQRGRHHKKKLYCLTCREEVNHIECRSEQEVLDFLEDFKKGVYANE